MWFLAHTWPYAGFAVATKKSINHVTSQKLKHEPEADFANYIRMDHLQVVEPPSQTHRLTLTTNRQSLNMSLNNRVNLYETLLEVSPFLMSHRVVCWAKVAYVDEALLIWLCSMTTSSSLVACPHYWTVPSGQCMVSKFLSLLKQLPNGAIPGRLHT